jgi:hypothetical protein
VGDQGEGVPVGLLKASVACVFNTSNTKPEREAAVFGDPLETLWKNCVFGLCGVTTFYRENFSAVVANAGAQRRVRLEKVIEVVGRYFSN